MRRLLLADDQALFRTALREVFDAEDDLEVVGEASTGPDLLERLEDLRPDVLLLDLAAAPGESGPDTIRSLIRRHPDLRILVLTAHAEDYLAVRCLRAGAHGYLTKDRAAHDLLVAVRHVAVGRKYVTPALAEHLATAVAEGASAGPPHESLSPRERQVVEGLARARTVSEIARELGLSVKTVSTYRLRAIDKLGLTNNAQAMLYALSHGLVDLRTSPRRRHGSGDPEPH